ncbi:MAG: YifB family Mg chelatase-like AAA ATPase, partial [Rhodospirillaceae bacterium]|nr:YifB family Mg chelatase-like AAA ATPase [Rhodospirillaceae bacterium]
ADMGVLPGDEIGNYLALGELALDGSISAVSGVLPAAIHASAKDLGLICPSAQGPEAAWAGDIGILAPGDLLALVNHFKGTQLLSAPKPGAAEAAHVYPDLADIKGQESAKRALEVAAAGGHNLLMAGPPGAGKSMLASRLPGLLPELDTEEILQTSMIQSLAGTLASGGLSRDRPFRDPHHSASMAALVGGGHKVKPGEVSLAHLGVLFLDELPEFNAPALEALRQPLESGRVTVARANAHVSYPARFQLIAAMNPCRCGHLDDPGHACSRAPRCAEDYQSKISGPLFDRIDMHIDVAAVNVADLGLPPPAESSLDVAARVAAGRALQKRRYASHPTVTTNAEADGTLLDDVATPNEAGHALLLEAAESMRLTARGYHRVMRVARTLADMDAVQTGDTDGTGGSVTRIHIAEALSYRRLMPGREQVRMRA